MKKITAIIIFSLLQVVSNAQNAAIDFAKMYNAYLGNYLSLDFAVTQYNTADDNSGKPVGTGSIRKSKSDYYSSFDQRELIIADGHTLNIDHSGKRIMYYQNAAYTKIQKTNQAIMDTMLLLQADSVKFLGSSGNGRKYSIYSAGTDVYRTDVTIDTATWLIREIAYFYPAANDDADYGAYKIVIRYTKLSTEKPEDSFFDLSKYVDTGKSPAVASAYKNYLFTVIN